MRTTLVTTGFIALGVMSVSPLLSQAAPNGASVTGRVVDVGTGRGIAEAIVTAVPAGAASSTAVAVRTSRDGAWRIVLAERGQYRVQARAIGYAPVEQRVSVDNAMQVTIDFRLTAVPVSLDEITVTASRREQRLADAIVPTAVITQRDIEESGATDIASVLTEQVGIQLDAGVPAGAGAQLQGFGGRRVLILLDGQPLIGRVNGNADLARLPTAMLSRIEVVKGPQSTLFGSDALGGVINLVTNRAVSGQQASITVSAIGGSQGRRDAGVTLSDAVGRLEYSADAGRHEISLTPGVSGDNDTFSRKWNGQGSVEWRASPTLSVFAGGFGISEEQRYRTGQIYHFVDNDQWSTRAGLRIGGQPHRLTPLVYYSRFTHFSRGSLSSQPASDSGARDVQELAELELTYAGSLARVAIDAGLELRREHITADRVPGGRRSLDVAEPYVQLTVPVGAVSLVAGSRVTWSEQWGRSFTPRVAALWRPVAPLGIRASLARGFRAPDFKELYLEFVNQAAGYAVVGNPDLDPEHSTSAAVSAEWAGTRVYSRVEGFRHRYRNFIEALAADESGTFTYGNVGSGTVTGTELHLATNAGIFRAEAGYAYLHSRDEETGYSLLGRPEHSGRLTLGVAAARWPRLNVSAVYTGETPIARDEEGRTSATQAAYTRLDVRLAHDVPGALTLVLGADNVLDRQLGDDWPGYTGRRLYAGATWRPLELRSRRGSP